MTKPDRLYFLDNLRIAAFAILVVYHVGMYYVTWTFHVKSPFASASAEPWMMISSPWRMSLLFMVSGAATALMLRSGASGALLRSRSKRLLWPLLFGMLVVIPPQSYFEVMHRFHYSGDYLDFLRVYFTSQPWRPEPAFCEGRKCLILPTWNHLWFLVYLWAYTVILWLALRCFPHLLDPGRLQAARPVRFLSRFVVHYRGAWLVAVPIALLTLVRWSLAQRFPETHAFTDDWFMHAVYFLMFAAGALFVNLPATWQEMERLRWIALGLAFTAWLLWVVLLKDWPAAWRRVDYSVLQWSALLAAFGFAHRHWNREHRWRAHLTEAVFPVYILHQTILIVLTQVALPFGLKPALEAPLLILATFLLSYSGFVIARRLPWLRSALGIHGKT